MFDSDAPIKNEYEDKLNRVEFVKKLSHSLCYYEHKECLVLGLMGEWGSGKSSILNLMFNEIKNNRKDWIFVEFNPWYFSNKDNLILQFLNSLFNELNFSKKIKRKAKNAFKKFIKGLSVNINYENIAASMDFDKIFSNEEYEKFTTFKKDLDNIFKELDFKIIISIDNIDRLTNDEINQIFTMVKSFADFPNVIYILCFDNEIILKSLKSSEIPSPENFLKKIIQIPITVPQITESKLDFLIRENIEPIYNDNIYSLNKFMDNGFLELMPYLKMFLKNIRDLKRYLNILNFYCTELIEEINIVDLMLILALQTFQSDVYHEIKNNKEFLTLTYDDQPNFENMLSDLFNKLKNLFHDFKDHEINLLLCYMFPIFTEYFGATLYVKRETLKNKFRISEPEHFDKYFTLTLEESEVSDFYINSVIQYDSQHLSKELIFLRNNHKLDSFLDKLYPKIDEMELTYIKTCIETLLHIADEFFNESILYNTKVNLMLNKLFSKLQLDEECFEILETNLDQTKNIFTITELIYGIGYNYGQYNESYENSDKEFITLEEFKILENSLYKKIIELKNTGDLARNNYLSILLKYWEDISNESEVNDFVKSITENPQDLINFLYKFRRVYNYSAYPSNKYSFDFEKLKKYFDLNELYRRITTILKTTEITTSEKEFCEYFLQELSKTQRFKDN